MRLVPAGYSCGMVGGGTDSVDPVAVHTRLQKMSTTGAMALRKRSFAWALSILIFPFRVGVYPMTCNVTIMSHLETRSLLFRDFSRIGF